MRLARTSPRALVIAAALLSIQGSLLLAASPVRSAQTPRARGRASTESSAVSLLNRAFADARARGSFRETVGEAYGSTHGTLVDDVALSSGRQVIVSSDGTRAAVLVVGRTAYISGNERALRSYFKFPATELGLIGNGWVSIPSTSSAYAAVAYDVTVPTALAEVAPTGRLTEGPRTTINGQRVIAISGGVPTVAAVAGTGRATLYVTASKHPLPVSASMTAARAGHPRMTVTATLSDWGERVAVQAPATSLSVGRLAALQRRLAALAIPGAPGYFSFTGRRGYPAPVGRPWGRACEPIRLAVTGSVPAWVYAQAATVIDAARKQGIDIALETRRLTWNHRALFYLGGQSPKSSEQVRLAVDNGTPPKLADGRPQHIRIDWGTTLAGKRHEALTRVSATLWVAGLVGQPQIVRTSIRQLIAMTQGISLVTNPASGMLDGARTDRFTRSDIAAMLRMSGCRRSTSVIGIAA